jgi:hypothetical protein
VPSDKNPAFEKRLVVLRETHLGVRGPAFEVRLTFCILPDTINPVFLLGFSTTES